MAESSSRQGLAGEEDVPALSLDACASEAVLLGRASPSAGAQAGAQASRRDDAPSGALASSRDSDAIATATADEAALAAMVQRAQGGDEAALAELIENNHAWVRGIAYAVLGDAHLAEDAAQEVCVRVVKHLRGLDAAEAFRPWLYRMTRNLSLSMAQRRERWPQPLSLDAVQLQTRAGLPPEEIPGAALEEGERVGTILEAIERLPGIYREVLVLKHVQELSYSQMSSILGVSVKSLEVRLVRARKLLQERLGRRFDRGRKRDPRAERESGVQRR